MKSLKMFGLAALAALMAMGFVGASSAMAEHTALCVTDSALCASPITHVHLESVGKVKILGPITVECNVLFLGDALLTGGVALSNPLIFHGTTVRTNCGSCVVEEENGPAELKLLKEGHETGKLTAEFLMHVECSGFIDCSYNGVGLKATAKGPLLSTQANGEVTLSEQTLNKESGGFLCPSTAKLHFTFVPLVPFYIST